jgi:serine/threonine-protein kinase
VVVPSTVGANQAEAKVALDLLGLTFVVTEKRYSEDIPEGLVIESNPAAGKRVEQGGNINLVISKGPERYVIPQLVGLTPEAAENLLSQLPIKLQPIVEKFSSEIPKGYVMDSNPISGEKVKRNSKIAIIVSKGIEQVKVASYTGKSSEQALNELTEAGFDVETKYDFSETRLLGEVISQKPVGGKEVDKGSKVELIVSKGSQYAYIPNLFSVEEAKAVQTLKDLGLKVTVKKIGKKAVKKVTNIAPKVGTKVKRGGTVTITVG